MHKNRKTHQTQNGNSSNSSIGSGTSPNQDQQTKGNASGECTLCKRTSVCVCQRCGDYYCSPECQRKDWQSHRYICFPMPALVKAYSDVNVLQNNSGIPLLSTPELNGDKKEKSHDFNAQNQEQNMRQGQQSHQKEQQKNNAPKNAQISSGNPPTSPLPPKNSRVVITGFRSPNRVYVRSVSASEEEEFMRNAKLIDAYGKTAPKLQRFPANNSFAITHMDRDGIMYRVQILGVANKSIRVLFSDYGNTATRQLSDLREISEEILSLQQHAVQVSLKGVENYSINDDLTSFMLKFIDAEFKIQYNAEDERNKMVILRSYQDNNTLNNKLTQFAGNMQIYDKNNTANSTSNKGNTPEVVNKKNENQMPSNKENRQVNRNVNTEKTKSADNVKDITPTNMKPTKQDTDSPTLEAPFATRILKKDDENIDVLVLDNSCLELGYFGCIPIDDIKNLSKVHEYLENFKDNNEAYEPRLNEYCVAKFEDAWYRAKVTAIPKNNHYTVLYVDYTNESTVQSKDIRPYPKDLELDCTTNLCLIHGLPEDLNDSMVKSLQTQIVLNKPITINKVKGIDDQIVIVDLPNILKKI